MMNEAPKRASRRSIWFGIGLAALAVAAYAEFISPSLTSETRECFGNAYSLRLDLVTRTSPILGRVVGREAILLRADQETHRIQSALVTDEVWSRRELFQRASLACLAEGGAIAEGRLLYGMMLSLSYKSGDTSLGHFLHFEWPAA